MRTMDISNSLALKKEGRRAAQTIIVPAARVHRKSMTGTEVGGDRWSSHADMPYRPTVGTYPFRFG